MTQNKNIGCLNFSIFSIKKDYKDDDKILFSESIKFNLIQLEKRHQRKKNWRNVQKRQ